MNHFLPRSEGIRRVVERLHGVIQQLLYQHRIRVGTFAVEFGIARNNHFRFARGLRLNPCRNRQLAGTQPDSPSNTRLQKGTSAVIGFLSYTNSFSRRDCGVLLDQPPVNSFS